MNPTEEFIQLLTACQGRLYAYIRTLVADAERARDILQNTNLVLWRKSGEFLPGSDFGAWACRVALYQVMAWRRDAGRDRHVFDDEIIQQLAEDAGRRGQRADALQAALRNCLESLTDSQRALLRRKYFEQTPVAEIAAEQQRTPNAVSRSLYHIRKLLLLCMERTTEQGA